MRQIWPEVLEVVKRERKRTHALLLTSTVATLEGELLTLSIGSPPLARMLSEQSNVEQIRSALREVLGVEWQVRTTVEGAGGAPSAGPPSAAPGTAPQRSDPAPATPTPTPTATPTRPPETSRSSAPPSASGSSEDAGGSDGPPVPEVPPDYDDGPEPDPRDDPYASELIDPGPPPAAKPSTEDAAISLLQSSLGARALESGS